MKKNNILKVVLFTILVCIVCTWVFNSAQITTTGVEGTDRVQFGLFTTGSYVNVLFTYFYYVILTALSVGAFYGVAYRIPAYRDLLDDIVEKFKGKENIFLGSVMALIAIIVSITGLQLGIIFVFPFIISIIVLMGYNKLVAATVTVGSTIVGLIGTTLGTSTTYYINTILNTQYNNEMLTKFILLVIGLALLIYNVIVYANKTKNTTDKELAYVPFRDRAVASEKAVVNKEKKENFISKIVAKIKAMKVNKKNKVKKEKVEKKPAKKEDKKVKTKEVVKTKEKAKAKVKTTAKKKAPAKKSTKTKASDAATSSVKIIKTKSNQKVWPFIVVFDLLLIIMILSVFDWSTVCNTTWPSDALTAIKEFNIGGFPIFDKLLGSVKAFGLWSLNSEIFVTIFVFAGILAFMYRVKFDKFIEGVLDGMKRAFVPALTMFLVYFVLIICVEDLFQLHILKFFLGLTKGFNVLTMTVGLMFTSVFSVEPLYLAQVTLPYVTTVVTDTTLYPILGVMTQAVYGLMMLVAPTSAVLVGVLSFLDIPYLQWLKHIWKLFVELLIVLVVLFLILVIV